MIYEVCECLYGASELFDFLASQSATGFCFTTIFDFIYIYYFHLYTISNPMIFAETTGISLMEAGQS